MNFDISGTRTTVTTTTVVEKFEDCTVELGKAKIREYTQCPCPSSEDGDPSVWYDYAEEAMKLGVPHKIDATMRIDEDGNVGIFSASGYQKKEYGTVRVVETTTTVTYEWDNLEVLSR